MRLTPSEVQDEHKHRQIEAFAKWRGEFNDIIKRLENGQLTWADVPAEKAKISAVLDADIADITEWFDQASEDADRYTSELAAKYLPPKPTVVEFVGTEIEGLWSMAEEMRNALAATYAASPPTGETFQQAQERVDLEAQELYAQFNRDQEALDTRLDSTEDYSEQQALWSERGALRERYNLDKAKLYDAVDLAWERERTNEKDDAVNRAAWRAGIEKEIASVEVMIASERRRDKVQEREYRAALKLWQDAELAFWDGGYKPYVERERGNVTDAVAPSAMTEARSALANKRRGDVTDDAWLTIKHKFPPFNKHGFSVVGNGTGKVSVKGRSGNLEVRLFQDPAGRRVVLNGVALGDWEERRTYWAAPITPEELRAITGFAPLD